MKKILLMLAVAAALSMSVMAARPPAPPGPPMPPEVDDESTVWKCSDGPVVLESRASRIFRCIRDAGAEMERLFMKRCGASEPAAIRGVAIIGATKSPYQVIAELNFPEDIWGSGFAEAYRDFQICNRELSKAKDCAGAGGWDLGF